MDHDYEKLGAFYLGRVVDPATGKPTDTPLLYDSKDLTTHGVIIGMTGSGKTGLAIGLLEEAVMDRVPVLAIDPKGDLANILLTFPDLAPADFRPWINEDTARRKGIDPDAFAAQQAELWRSGLAEWDQDGERIRRLRESAEFTIYTPGSSAGTPISVLGSFGAPPPDQVADTDAFRDRISSTVTGLLGLLGIEADPVQSREHILLSSILADTWQKGINLDLGGLIQAIQQPAFTKLGVMELESVYPAKDRFALAMQLNGLLASPGFQAWMEGEPLDIGAMLYTASGKPRVSVMSIAHLNEAERMFFVTMLLSAVVAWMRAQSGTTSLRALLYMDEVFGFFPPVANPPSKGPMLTLLKQARAYGVGVVLATQNPVDLDYKGLGNTGTWFVGRLQTDRDKARVLEALDGAMAGSTPMPRAELDKLISGLGKRVFLMHNVHEGAPTLMTTRWVMSYLAGPLTLTQLRSLAGESPAAASPPAATGPPAGPPAAPAPRAVSRPILPREVRQFFAPPARSAEGSTYQPAFMVAAEVRYSSSKYGVDETRSLQVVVPLDAGPIPFSLDRAEVVDLPVELLEAAPRPGAGFARLPSDASQPKHYDRWGKEVVRWIKDSRPITLYSSARFKEVSRPGESERDFRMRLADLSRQTRDDQADKLRKKYEPRLETLQERLRRAKQAVEKKKGQSQQALLSTGVAAIGGLLGALLGGRKRSQIGRVSTAARSAGRVVGTRQDIAHADETVEAVQVQLADLEREFQAELDQVANGDGSEEPLEEVQVRANLNAISLRLAALVWRPTAGGKALGGAG